MICSITFCIRLVLWLQNVLRERTQWWHFTNVNLAILFCLKLWLFHQGQRNMPREMHHPYRGRDDRRSGGFRGGNAPSDAGGLLGASPNEPANSSSGYFLYLIKNYTDHCIHGCHILPLHSCLIFISSIKHWMQTNLHCIAVPCREFCIFLIRFIATHQICTRFFLQTSKKSTFSFQYALPAFLSNFYEWELCVSYI